MNAITLCLIALLQWVHLSLGQAILNTPLKIEGRSNCSDPFFPFLLATQGLKTYGCCSIRPQNIQENNKYCCLLAGSICSYQQPNNPNYPHPCKQVSCCSSPTRNVNGYTYLVARLNAGTVFDRNLRSREPSTLPSEFVDYRTPRIILNKKPDQNDKVKACSDPLKKLLLKASFHGMSIQGCCSREPKDPDDTAASCCIVGGEQCDGIIPCCNGQPCELGQCPPESASPTDKLINGDCEYYYKVRNKTVSATLKASGKTCKDPYLTTEYSLSSGGNACCKKGVDLSQANKGCCLEANSPCDGTIDCCNGMPCCGGLCPAKSGDATATNLIVSRPLC